MTDQEEHNGSKKAILSARNRAVTAGGNIINSVIITGDGNTVSLDYGEQFHYQVLDDYFRQAQQGSAPADFYNGTRANWRNISRKDDAPRILYRDVRAFVEDQNLPAQRMCLITGLAGEGKTTLLMRLAWDLAESGYPVFWRHFGKAFSTSSFDLESSRPVILCFDQVGDESQLPLLVRDLCQFGISFIILGTERQNEWQSAGLEAELNRSLYFKIFKIRRLVESEVVSLLDRLESASKLDALAELSQQQRVRHFLNRLEADGQLLPALLTSRTGKQSFDAIILDMLERIKKRSDGDFLIYSYVLIASIHRWGRGLSSSLFGRCMEIDEGEIQHRILRYLSGEILELTLGENDHLYTRHPFIADRALQLADSYFLAPKGIEIYKKLLQAIGQNNFGNMASQPHLLTIIPIAYKRTGDVINARNLFQESAKANPKHAPTWQAWGVLEKEFGNYDEARRLFKEATKADPRHAPSWQAWALMEKELGNYDEARRLFKEATKADPKHAPAWQPWALMEKELGNYDEARRLFKEATKADPKNAPSWQAWALMEKELGNYDEARRLFKEATKADPKHAPAWQPWALMEKELGNHNEARRLFNQAPKDAPSWQAWALMEKELRNHNEARRLFKEATKADPRHAPSWQAWALMEKQLGNHNEAHRLFKEATKVNPKHAPSWQAWALMEKQLGNHSEARRLFNQAPKDAPSWQAWALMEKELGNHNEARRLFKEATKADPKHAPAWQAWGVLEKEFGNYDEARRLFKEATKADPKHAPAWQPWALMELELGNLGDALDHAQRAVKLQPQDFYPYIARGRVLLASGQSEKSKSDLEKAKSIIQKRLQNQKRNTKLQNIYCEILIELEEYGQAKEILQQSLSVSITHNKQFVHILLGKLYAAQNFIGQAIVEFEKALQYSPNNLEAKKLLEKFRIE